MSVSTEQHFLDSIYIMDWIILNLLFSALSWKWVWLEKFSLRWMNQNFYFICEWKQKAVKVSLLFESEDLWVKSLVVSSWGYVSDWVLKTLTSCMDYSIKGVFIRIWWDLKDSVCLKKLGYCVFHLKYNLSLFWLSLIQVTTRTTAL